MPLPFHGLWMVKFFLLGKSMCTTPEAYKGSALKGGQYPLGYIQPYHLSTSLPIHHHGGHLPILVCATGVLSPPEVTSSPSATWRVVCGCHPYEGLGHWLGVGGSLGVLWGVSGPFPAFVLQGSTNKNFFFLFYLDNL